MSRQNPHRQRHANTLKTYNRDRGACRPIARRSRHSASPAGGTRKAPGSCSFSETWIYSTTNPISEDLAAILFVSGDLRKQFQILPPYSATIFPRANPFKLALPSSPSPSIPSARSFRWGFLGSHPAISRHLSAACVAPNCL